MASIKIFELTPAGAELFQDTESFLNELNDQESLIISGGNGSDLNISNISQATVSVGISIKSLSVVSQVKSNLYFGKRNRR
ncbi:hypothetical protein IQ230_16880 [Gloeocapsopsis crepidinum LEGE 06123]|uniref:Uncharacterized protein n=1 Tax=Gloeocapsopsis crepidinum LEGE 06123 TaxID=588587 RepID=A0ABR9UUS3_9CHRO|nr:hypothetical protein [Gloeocapsopsis crepidinum]MBE9191994.1 hypothetical protein [Gloeocapsopsis crepidinum LEGE 06123]